MKHKGGCHCGKVRYEVEMNLDKALSCNCSVCEKRGSLLGFAPDGTKTVAINVRTIDGIDLKKIAIQEHDGREI